MAKLYDVVAVTGKYTDKDGNEKNRYANIGAIIEGKNGPQLKLETVPLGWNGWAYLNEPQAKDAPKKFGGGKPASSGSNGFDDDVPF